MKTACAYIRVSTDYQLEYSPASQLKLISEYAHKNNLILNDNLIYKDEGISGRKAYKRPQFQKMLSDAKKNKFQVILIYNTSRFARNHEESIIYRAMLKKQGIDVISITQPNVDPKTDILMNALYAVMDERYSIELSENVMRGMKEKANRGEFLGSVPYGYKIKTSKTTPIINNEQAKIVKLIFDKFTEENMSTFYITKLLNSIGVKTSRNNKWEKRSIEYILKNEFYTGKYIWNKRNGSNNSLNEKSQWIIKNGKHTPIITQEQYNKAQNIFNKNIKPFNKNLKSFNKDKHWLSGIIKCSNCNKTLSSTRKGNKIYFQCTSYNKGKCNVSHFISESKIVSSIYKSFQEIININSNIRFKKIQKDNKEINITKKYLISYQKKLERIYESYINGIDTLEEYKINKNKIINEINFLNKKVIIENGNHKKNFIENLNDIYNILTDETTDYEIKNILLKNIIQKIIFHKKKSMIEIFYYYE